MPWKSSGFPSSFLVVHLDIDTVASITSGFLGPVKPKRPQKDLFKIPTPLFSSYLVFQLSRNFPWNRSTTSCSERWSLAGGSGGCGLLKIGFFLLSTERVFRFSPSISPPATPFVAPEHFTITIANPEATQERRLLSFLMVFCQLQFAAFFISRLPASQAVALGIFSNCGGKKWLSHKCGIWAALHGMDGNIQALGKKMWRKHGCPSQWQKA